MKERGYTMRRYPASELVEVPPSMFEVAERRTKHLQPMAHMAVAELLAHAYLQGMNDGFFVAQTPAGLRALAQAEP